MGQTNPKKKNKSDNDQSPQNKDSLVEAYRKLAPYLNIGYTWAASVILFTLLGWYLDKEWGTYPWLTFAGAIIGVIGGFYHFLRTVLNEDKRNQDYK